MESGIFTLSFGWAEGNTDTGQMQQDVGDFTGELFAFLLEHGAWHGTLRLYGPDGERLSPSDAENFTAEPGKMYGLVSSQGTAMPETAVCGTCYEHPNFKVTDQALDNARASADWSGGDTFTDVTGNSEMRCIECGAVTG